jgi:hypothetical protein
MHATGLVKFMALLCRKQDQIISKKAILACVDKILADDFDAPMQRFEWIFVILVCVGALSHADKHDKLRVEGFLAKLRVLASSAEANFVMKFVSKYLHDLAATHWKSWNVDIIPFFSFAQIDFDKIEQFSLKKQQKAGSQTSTFGTDEFTQKAMAQLNAVQKEVMSQKLFSQLSQGMCSGRNTYIRVVWSGWQCTL